MTRFRSISAATGLFLLVAPSALLAQSVWVPGSEIVGQSVQVQTNGINNTIYLDAGGAARIMTPNGTTVPASWTAADRKFCLTTGSASECWPYERAFRAGETVPLTSSCGAQSQWTANATNPMQTEQVRQPERG